VHAIALLVSGVIENNTFFFCAQNNNSVFLELKMALLSYLITITAHANDQVRFWIMSRREMLVR
jgi:hypothetical protein